MVRSVRGEWFEGRQQFLRAFLAENGFHAGVQVYAVRRALFQRPVQRGGGKAARQEPGPGGTQRRQGGPVKGNAVAAALAVFAGEKDFTLADI